MLESVMLETSFAAEKKWEKKGYIFSRNKGNKTIVKNEIQYHFTHKTELNINIIRELLETLKNIFKTNWQKIRK